MRVTCIYWPEDRERMLFKRAIRITMGDTAEPKNLPSSKLLHAVLEARHSPIRVLNFAFLIEGIPSNISVHLCRHVHAVPFVPTLRNDRQDRMDGDEAPRKTPVDMIFFASAEELMTVANKRLCTLASPKTQQVVSMMCAAALDKMPELHGLLVPMCLYHGGVCHEINGCGLCPKKGDDE